MALGLIQFLLGGKKKKTTSSNNDVNRSNQPSNTNTQNNTPAQNQGVDNNVQSNTQNNTASSEQTSNEANQNNAHSQQSSGNKKSVSEILMKMHKEMKESNERLTTVVTDVKKIENSVNSLSNRVDMIEKKDVDKEKKLKEIDSNMAQFLSLYELINNQYNPFVSDENQPKIDNSVIEEKPTSKEERNEPIEIETPEIEKESQENFNDNNNGSSLEFNSDEENTTPLREKPVEENQEEIKTITLPNNSKKTNFNENKDNQKMSQNLLELDTLNIEEAAADAVPLTKLKNNTNALVIILSWLEFLIKRVGISEARSTLRYYTETLQWITPEVFFDLDKYMKGMSDSPHPQSSKTTVKDHIVSLYFISKLNEKSLDHRLTKAVLEIIDQ